MITARDAVACGRALLGTPYSQLDCINFIKRIIHTAPGGDEKYTTAGTNTLWRSYSASRKYRDLTWRQEGLAGARAGMLAFKRSGDDVHHVGLVTGDGTVIHSSSARGCVVETALDESWALLAIHRDIAVEEAQTDGVDGAQARTDTAQGAATGGEQDAQRENGGTVTIIDDEGRCFRPSGGWRVYFGSID